VQPAGFRVPFEEIDLENGMRVILSPDHTVPVVAVYVLYGVGARSEERGRSGFAHLFEHMMFQGTRYAPKGTHFKLVESNGGSLNGSTHPDYTDYYETLPSNKLPVGLWLEADRMRGLAITEENLANQKAAVKEERRLSFDNQPYNSAIVDTWPELVFRNWSNAHSIIGSFEDLDAASVADVARFFRTYYAPNNAVISVAGDIQVPEARKLIEHYFGDIPPQIQPAHPNLDEPERNEPRFARHEDPHAQVPAVVLGWPGPPRKSEDYYALTMLDIILTGGDSSRFKLNLVKGRKSVIQFEANLGWPFANYLDYKDPHAYCALLLHTPAFTGRQVMEQVQEEISKIQNDGVDPGEMERARTFFRSSRIIQLQTALSRARRLAQYEFLDGDPDMVNIEEERFLAATPEAIRAAARKYLVPAKLAVLEIVPAPKPPAAREPTPSAGSSEGGE